MFVILEPLERRFVIDAVLKLAVKNDVLLPNKFYIQALVLVDNSVV